jgi:Flp pilus assembly protein TadG
MRASFHRGGRRRGSTLMMFMFMLPFLIIPLVGLGIDASRLYIVQAQLQSAVDGAALGSGRLLGTDANTAEIAGEFLSANFPSGFWATTNFQKTVTYTKTFIMNKIAITAQVDVPLLFARVFGQSVSTVVAVATATRKETRVELVIDRSGSMTELSSVQATATQFVQSFISGYDEMGLVVFSNSGVVGYPTTRPYNASTTSSGGPDTSFETTQTNGNVLTMISDLGSGGFTNMSEGLALAYIELQKANNRDNDPTRLNAIVLFTDGFPNAVSMYANDPSANSLLSTSKCKYNPATAGTTTADLDTQIVGWAGGGPGGTGAPYGLYFLANTATDTNTTAYWMTYSGKPDQKIGSGYLSQAVASCADLDAGTPNLGDLKQVPTTNYWGDSTSDGSYTTAFKSSASYSGQTYTSTSPNIAGNIGIAAWNATDAVGRRILSDTTLNPTIYVIGYTGSGGNPDTYLLKRLANTTDSTNYNSTWQTGIYVSGSDQAGLAEAFQAVAASILRLAQ